jgi:hypothetical protein
MMNDRIFRSMSAYSAVSDIIAQTNKILERNNSISDAVARSTSFMRDAENVAKYARSVMPMLDSTALFKNDALAA